MRCDVAESIAFYFSLCLMQMENVSGMMRKMKREKNDFNAICDSKNHMSLDSHCMLCVTSYSDSGTTEEINFLFNYEAWIHEIQNQFGAIGASKAIWPSK